MDVGTLDTLEYKLLDNGKKFFLYDHIYDKTEGEVKEVDKFVIGEVKEGVAWYHGSDIMFNCSVLEMNRFDYFSKVIETRRHSGDAFIRIYGSVQETCTIITQRVENSFDSYLSDKNTPIYDDNFATTALKDLIRSILTHAMEMNGNSIHLGTVTPSTILIVNGGNAKFIMTEGKGSTTEDVVSFKKMFMTALPNHSNKESCAFVEKESFCKYFSNYKYQYHHPFLMTHEERARMAFYLVTLYGNSQVLDGLYSLKDDWSSQIDHKSICGIVFGHSKIKRNDFTTDELPYGKSLISLAYFLRNFEVKWNSAKSRNAYRAQNDGDIMPSYTAEERSRLLVKEVGPKYLVNLYLYCYEKGLEYWFWTIKFYVEEEIMEEPLDVIALI